MPPPVSILLPVFNAEATLETTWKSLVRQRECRWECVAVDDGSSDRSAEILCRLAKEDSRLRVLHMPHCGIVASLNAGLDACEGDCVVRMDADDLMHQDRLSVQLGALHGAAHLAGVGCHVRLFPRRHLMQGRLEYEAWLNSLRDDEHIARDAFVECPLAHPTWMMRADVLREYRYRDMGWPEDYDLLLRMLGRGLRLGTVPRPLHLWRDGPQRLSRTSPNYASDRFVACKAHHLARTFLAGRRGYVLWGYGATGRTLARELIKEELRPSHIVEVHPGRIGQRILGAPVISPYQLPTIRFEKMIVSVAGMCPREQVRQTARALGYVETRDFVCAA